MSILLVLGLVISDSNTPSLAAKRAVKKYRTDNHSMKFQTFSFAPPSELLL